MRLVTSSRAAPLLMAAAAATLTLSAGSSPAAVTGWTVSPGGSFTGHAGTTELAGTTTGTPRSFARHPRRGDVQVRLRAGRRRHRIHRHGELPARLLYPDRGPLPWKVSARSYAPATGTTVGTITGVHLRFTDPAFCDLMADGTSATAGNGAVRFRYTDDTGRLQVLRTGGNLHIYRVRGCGGVFHNGDTATLSSTYLIAPVQAITSP